MLDSGFYQINFGGICFVSFSFFCVMLKLLVDVLNGVYMVYVYLFKSGDFLMEMKLLLCVVKIGIEQLLMEVVYGNFFLYGFFVVIIVFIIGWVGLVIFWKD